MWFPRIGRGGFFRESGFPGCVSEGFRQLSEEFPRGSRRFPEGFPKISRRGPRRFPEGFPTTFRRYPEDFRGVSEDFPKISRGVSEDVPRVSRSIGVTSGLGAYSGHFRCRGRLFRSLPGWGSFPVTSSDVTAIVLLIWISGSLIGPFGSRGRNAAL